MTPIQPLLLVAVKARFVLPVLIEIGRDVLEVFFS